MTTPTLTTRGPQEYATLAHLKGMQHEAKWCSICAAVTILTVADSNLAQEQAAHRDTAARLVTTREAFNVLIEQPQPVMA